ncbi:MAG: hypothetical protein ABF513_08305, partial [Acetobacter malorum]
MRARFRYRNCLRPTDFSEKPAFRPHWPTVPARGRASELCFKNDSFQTVLHKNLKIETGLFFKDFLDFQQKSISFLCQYSCWPLLECHRKKDVLPAALQSTASGIHKVIHRID